MDGPGEALVAIVAIVVGCWMLVQVAKYGARAVRSIFGSSDGAQDGASLTQGEVEGMIRRAVREEVRQEVKPLRDKIERIERRGLEGKTPRRDLPEDPHDFGLIAEEDGTREARDVA